jgi:hypothetical protein
MFDKLVFFDFDFTLAKTSESVKVWSPRGTRVHNNRRFYFIGPSEYNLLNLADDEEINEDSFSEFRSVNIHKAKAIKPVFYYLKLFLRDSKAKIKILSARPQVVEKDVFEFLLLNNVNDVKQIEFKGCGSSLAHVKYSYVRENTILYRPKEVLLFDDSAKVIDCVRRNFVNHFSNIELTTCLIEHGHETQNLKFSYHNGV